MARYRLSVPEFESHPGWTDPQDTESLRTWVEAQVPAVPGYSWFWEVIDDGGFVPPTPDAILTGRFRKPNAPLPTFDYDNRLWLSIYPNQVCLAGPIFGTNRSGITVSSVPAADLADFYDPV